MKITEIVKLLSIVHGPWSMVYRLRSLNAQT